MPTKVQTLPVVLLFIAIFASACSPTLAALPAGASEVINAVVEDNKI